MGHVERRVWSGKASYRARYRDPTGRERSKSFRRKRTFRNLDQGDRACAWAVPGSRL
jgi:hypothetical protein